MRLAFISMAVVLGGLMLVEFYAVAAPKPPGSTQFELVGFTTAETAGNVGRLGLSKFCSAEFPASRVCTSEEVLETPVLPNLSGTAWTVPSVKFGVVVAGSATIVDGVVGDWGNLTCFGWTQNASTLGLTLTLNAPHPAASGGLPNVSDPWDGFFAAECVARPVACCALVP